MTALWTMTNCMIDCVGCNDAPKDVPEYYITAPHFSLSVKGDILDLYPNAEVVANSLQDILHRRAVYNLDLKFSDTMIMSKEGMTLPLGALVIFFGIKDPCPTFSWQGKPSANFDLLNEQYKKFQQLKIFW